MAGYPVPGFGADLFPEHQFKDWVLFFPGWHSDLWETNLENLTLSKSDMVNTCYGGEYEFYFNRHASFSLEIGSYARTVYAQYRDYTYQDGSPIFQDISLRIVPDRGQPEDLSPGPPLHALSFYRDRRRRLRLDLPAMGRFHQLRGRHASTKDSPRPAGSPSASMAASAWPTASIRGWRSPWKGNTCILRGRLSKYFQGFEPLDLGGFSANASINLYLR